MLRVIVIGMLLGFVQGVVWRVLIDLLPWIRQRRKEGQPVWSELFRLYAGKHSLEGLLTTIAVPGTPVMVSQTVLIATILAGSYIVLSLTLKDSVRVMSSYTFISYGLLVAAIDLKYRLVLYSVSLAGALIGLGVGTLCMGFAASLIGGATNLVVFWVIYWLGKKLPVFSSRAEDGVAMGFGDVVLAGVLGLYLGFPRSYFGLLAGTFLGLLGVVVIIILRKISKSEARSMPYAPALVLGAVIVMLVFG